MTNFFREINDEHDLDYLEIEKILKEVKFNDKSKPILLPYSPLYKVGTGFNLEDGSVRASPFIAEILFNAEPDSLEGTDGKIRKSVFSSAKDFA